MRLTRRAFIAAMSLLTAGFTFSPTPEALRSCERGDRVCEDDAPRELE